MPISSGAGGKAARLHLNVGGKSRSHWPNANANAAALPGTVAHASGAAGKSRSVPALSQRSTVVNERPSGASSSSTPSTSTFTSSPPSATSLWRPLAQEGARAMSSGAAIAEHQEQNQNQNQSRLQQNQDERRRRRRAQATVEQYKQIRHISPPSSRATTSASAFKYFAGATQEARDSDAENSEERAIALAASESSPAQRAAKSAGKRTRARRPAGAVSSLGGQLVVTGSGSQVEGARADGRLPPPPLAPAKPSEAMRTQADSNVKRSGGGGGLFSSLMTLGGGTATGAKQANSSSSQQHQQHQRQHHFSTFNQHSASQTSLNPTLSFGCTQGSGRPTVAASSSSSSAASSAANLHSLASLQALQTRGSSQGLTPAANSASATINKRINLKYVKTLIIVLMSLDLAVTLFVHHFASNDEFSLILTRHKLRFSLVNLVLSAIWFVVLAGAILFDVYAILLIGALVDIASFILLLVCSVVHFTHRIDYNTANLTSLLLLLFSIITLHVYLLVISALTLYLMAAVKRRRKH